MNTSKYNSWGVFFTIIESNRRLICWEILPSLIQASIQLTKNKSNLGNLSQVIAAH